MVTTGQTCALSMLKRALAWKSTLPPVVVLMNISYGYRRYNICQLKVYNFILEPSANHVVINFTQGSPESLLADTSSQFHGMAKAAGILENHHLHDDWRSVWLTFFDWSVFRQISQSLDWLLNKYHCLDCHSTGKYWYDPHLIHMNELNGNGDLIF